MSTIWRHPALSEYASVEPIEDDALLLSPDFVSCLPSAGLIASAYASFTPDAESLGWLDGACGAPVVDFLGSSLGARASALGLVTGCAFYHHERRVRLGMPEDMLPEVSVWSHDRLTTPVWEGGVLTEPKYFSFFQDAALPSYNPNHRSKWRAHELLHAAVGFYWSPTQTRFQAYVGARLGELLPVVHWYGFDEIGRARCVEHKHGDPPKHTCIRCEARARGIIRSGIRPDGVASRALARQALDHFDAEWRACLQEIERGRVVRAPHARLDASSDSIGYLRGHWPRLTSSVMGAWVEYFCVEGVDYQSDLEDYAANVSSACADLLMSEIEVEPTSYIRRRQRRALRDVAWRALLAMAHTSSSPSDSVERGFARIAARCEQLLDADASGLEAVVDDRAMVDELFEAIAADHTIPEEILAALPALGHDFLDGGEGAGFVPSELDQIMEGVQGAVPVTFEALVGAEVDLQDVAITLASSPWFGSPGLLSLRVTRVLLDQEDELLAMLGGLAEIEAWLARPPRTDAFADAFAMLPEDAEQVIGSRLSLRASARRAVWPLELFAAAIGDEEEHEPDQEIEVAAAVVAGELVILEVDEALSHWWEIAERGRAVTAADVGDHGESLIALLEAGVLVWSGGGE
jgi:hypothetical protein